MGRKKKLVYESPGPKRYDKWKIGDEVTCRRESDGKLGYGKILEIHPECADGSAYFTFCCELLGSFQLAKFSSIVANPTAAQRKKRNKARMNLIKQMGSL